MDKIKVIITGGAGFIGSNLTEALLSDGNIKKVRVIDDLSNGYYSNIEEFEGHSKFEFIQEDIRNYRELLKLTKGYDVISHQAALGSVPRSIADPMSSTSVNIDGTVNVLNVAVKNGLDRVILACSSSTYGDSKQLPKKEDNIGAPLSPYAVTKLAIELYADVFNRTYGLNYIGLRYFNVFGPKQNPDNPYAAVIPIFCKAFMNNESPKINGDGETSRDFTYVSNAIHANVLSIFTQNQKALNQVYNVACGERTSLNSMVEELALITGKNVSPKYGLERPGDVKHSLADISKIQDLLGYNVNMKFKEGLKEAFNWYKNNY